MMIDVGGSAHYGQFCPWAGCSGVNKKVNWLGSGGAHTFNPRTREQRQVDLSKFKASLVSRGSSRTVRTVTQRKRNPILKKKERKKTK